MTKTNAIRYLTRLKPKGIAGLKMATAKISAWAKRAGLKRAKSSGIYSHCWIGRNFVIKVPRHYVLGGGPHRTWNEIITTMKMDKQRRMAFMRIKGLTKHVPITVYVNTIFAVQERADIDSTGNYWDTPQSFHTRKVRNMIDKFERLQVRDIHCENIGFRKDRTPVLIDLGTEQHVRYSILEDSWEV